MSMANGQGRAIQRSSNEKMSQLRHVFEKSKPNIAALLPKHLTAEKVLKLVLSAASRTPTLLECTPTSILLSTMQSAALGLEPNTPLQQAYLVPYWNNKIKAKEAQFIPGYRGLIQLAIQSGEVRSIEARVVHERDEFQVRYGLDATIIHIPYMLGDPGPLVAVYALAKFHNGDPNFEVMTKYQVDQIRKFSKSGESGPWVDHYEEMARKTVVRRLAKMLPMSVDKSQAFNRALEHQAAAEAGDGPDFSDVIEGVVDEPEKEAEQDELANRLASKAAERKGEVQSEVLTEQLKASVNGAAKPTREPGED
jgi:recombination protein RecT